jgi:hypothetical protein
VRDVKENRVTYPMLYKFIKSVYPKHSVRSIRRGAMTALSHHHEIGDLMLMGTHTSESSSRRYIAPQETQVEAQRMLTMSRRLLSGLQ